MNNGRRRPVGGRSDAKERILKSAARRFGLAGYAGTTLRAVAADCNVDVALISYYFGSKHGLFSAAMQLSVSPVDVLRAISSQGPVDAGRLLATVIGIWDDPTTGLPLRAMAQRALTNQAEQIALRQYLESELVPMLARQLGGRERERRARAAVYVLAGVVLSHHVLGLNEAHSPQQLFEDLIRPFTAALTEPGKR